MVNQARWLTIFWLAVGMYSTSAGAAKWQMVADSSTVRFIGIQEASAFRGRFQNFTAMINFDPDNPSDGKIIGVVKMDSAKTGDAERDATLLEEDWFNPEIYPESRFESERIEALDDGTYAAHGVLTIIGNSNPVTMAFEFDVSCNPVTMHYELDVSCSTAHFSGSFDVLRLDFGVGWDATNWIDDLVGVQVELDLE